MAPTLVQSTFNAVAKYQTRSCTATFSDPTTPGNLLVVVCLAAGTYPSRLAGPAGFTLVASRGQGYAQMSVWYQQNAPATSSVSVTALDDDKSIQLRVLEYSGMAQASVVDKVLVSGDEDDYPTTGITGTTSQGDSLVLAFSANEYASTVQSGFAGGLIRLFESVSPQYYGRYGSNQDWERGRLICHHYISTSVGAFFLALGLSTVRHWLTFLIVFKGGSLGPAKMSATVSQKSMVQTARGALSAFGPLHATSVTTMVQTAGSAVVAPFNYQYLLNNSLLLTGVDQDGPYQVISHDGLYGVNVRTSDDDQPRGDGALRGIDLQSARTVTFEVQIADDPDGIERRLDVLSRALVPQRDTDWPLVWRHPGQPAKVLYCRPTDVPRAVDRDSTIRAPQTLALRAADPRHYGFRQKSVTIPNTPAGSDPVKVNVTNGGDIAAYPVITVLGPTTGPAVTKVSLVNATSLVTFDVTLTLAKGSVLIGDMQARVTGAPRSAITLDGQSKYGSWQLPRAPFRIDADPTGQLGYNVLYLQTVPAGAPVTCTITYRDCWSG